MVLCMDEGTNASVYPLINFRLIYYNRRNSLSSDIRKKSARAALGHIA